MIDHSFGKGRLDKKDGWNEGVLGNRMEKMECLRWHSPHQSPLRDVRLSFPKALFIWAVIVVNSSFVFARLLFIVVRWKPRNTTLYLKKKRVIGGSFFISIVPCHHPNSPGLAPYILYSSGRVIRIMANEKVKSLVLNGRILFSKFLFQPFPCLVLYAPV